MTYPTGPRCFLSIPRLFEGEAGVGLDGVIGFIKKDGARTGTMAADLDGQPVTLLVTKPINYDRSRHPFLTAIVVSQ